MCRHHHTSLVGVAQVLSRSVFMHGNVLIILVTSCILAEGFSPMVNNQNAQGQHYLRCPIQSWLLRKLLSP